jgi:hypothetical protein
MNRNSSWTLARRALFTVVATVLALTAGAATPAGAATRAGGAVRPQWQNGGCHRDTDGGPFTASACISAQTVYSGRAHVTFVNTDAYVDVKPAGCFQLEIDLYDHNGNRVAQGDWQRFCTTGRYIGQHIAWPWGQPFYSELTIVNGHNVYVIDSWYLG